MHYILDHISAVVIGSVVLLILVALHLNLRQASLDEQNLLYVKKQAISLTTWIEDDLLRMGLEMPSDERPFSNPRDSVLASGRRVTTEFTFRRIVIEDRDHDDVEETYDTETQFRLRPSGERNGTPLFRLERFYRENGGAWRADGSSPPLLSEFQVEMLDRDADMLPDAEATWAADPDGVWNTRVRLALVPPFPGSHRMLSSVGYASTLLIDRTAE